MIQNVYISLIHDSIPDYCPVNRIIKINLGISKLKLYNVAFHRAMYPGMNTLILLHILNIRYRKKKEKSGHQKVFYLFFLLSSSVLLFNTRIPIDRWNIGRNRYYKAEAFLQMQN